MWRALETDGLPYLPSRMSLDSCAMSCRVTSRAILAPRPGLTKRRRWLATLVQLSIRERSSPSSFTSSCCIQSMRSSMIFATILPCFALTVLVWRSCLTSVAGSRALSAYLAAGVIDGEGFGIVDA